jgi:heat-inducible transcriptional repressor
LERNIADRQDRIFDIIVRSYIETAEPVGSRTISKRYSEGLSPASIRNVMADLEEEGLITHPHTSAGRIPTDKGYRYYVDRLMEPEEITDKEKDWIHKELAKAKTVEGLAERVSKVVSELTESTALLYIKSLKRVSFLNYLLEELVESQRLSDFLEEESELFIEGAFRIFEQPEFQDMRKMRLLLQAFDEKYNFLQIFVKDLEEEGVHIHIGRENDISGLNDISLVVKDCYLGEIPIGGVAAVGPTRMKYSKIVAVVDYVADSITDTVKRF